VEEVNGAPGVGHFIRVFLSRTETFVYNQLRTLERYRPTAFCHHTSPSFAGDFDVVSVRDSAPPVLRTLDDLSYRTIRRLPGPSATLLARAVRARSIDVLHFHYLVDARFFLDVKRKSGLPAVVSGYGYDVSLFPLSMKGYGRRYLAALFREMDCFLAMSEDMEKDLVAIGCPPEKVVVHYYGTETDRFVHAGRTYGEVPVVNVLAVGTLEPKKAQDRVLRALAQWNRSQGGRQRFTVTFAGDGPLRPELEAIVRELGWEDRVTFHGHVPHEDPLLVDLYRAADVFALPSVTIGGDKEGIPGTIVEAMAAGLPVVATYHAGIPAAVTHEETGLLVREDDFDGLAASLGRLIEDASLRERLGRRAAADAHARLRLHSKTPHLEELYDRVRSRVKGPAGGALGVPD
jgi:glycosyltransferase involved in cell wall biosynthesis